MSIGRSTWGSARMPCSIQRNEGQISPRIGVTYRYNPAHAFHAFYGRMFTPPNLEAISFAKLNTAGTKAAPEDTTNNLPRAERAHYFQIGSTHGLTDWATLQLTGYYKLANYLSDAGQFGTTPLLNYFAFERGWSRGADAALKVWLTENLTGRGNIAWGQCKGYGLQSGHFFLEAAEIADIKSAGGSPLRSPADADGFGRAELPIVRANDHHRAGAVCLGIADGGRRWPRPTRPIVLPTQSIIFRSAMSFRCPGMIRNCCWDSISSMRWIRSISSTKAKAVSASVCLMPACRGPFSSVGNCSSNKVRM